MRTTSVKIKYNEECSTNWANLRRKYEFSVLLGAAQLSSSAFTHQLHITPTKTKYLRSAALSTGSISCLPGSVQLFFKCSIK